MKNNLLTGLKSREMRRNFPCVKIGLVGGGILFRGTNEFPVRIATERFGDSLSIVPRLKRKEEDHHILNYLHRHFKEVQRRLD